MNKIDRERFNWLLDEYIRVHTLLGKSTGERYIYKLQNDHMHAYLKKQGLSQEAILDIINGKDLNKDEN